MKTKLICSLIVLGIVSNSMIAVFPVKAAAAKKTTMVTTSTIKEKTKNVSISSVTGIVTPMTAYDWWVYNLGVSKWGISQIKGPMSGGSFNTEGIFGANRTFTISWSGASSNSYFKIKAVGQDSGNNEITTYSGYCSGSSGSVELKIPYDMRGIINLYVDSHTSTDINIDSLHVDSK